jgi:hypothetical protein
VRSPRTPRRASTPVAGVGRGLAAALLAALATACGVTTEDHPEHLAPSMVPAVPTPTVTVVPDVPAPGTTTSETTPPTHGPTRPR